jgi:ATP-dependent DNA ligase
MLKNIGALYCPDKRPSNNWWKVKKHMTYDVVCTGFSPGKGKYKGLIGAITFGLFKDGTLVECGNCSGITDALRKEITSNPDEFLMRVMEIKAMERTSIGHFRHPVFGQWRTDKLPTQCLWNQ